MCWLPPKQGRSVMCVAAVIFQPLKLSEIQLMHDSNPHGLGVGWHDKQSGKLKYAKGLAPEAVFDLQESGKLTYPYMFHARWATHGPKVPELCHPFPVGVQALFDSPEGEADQLLQHNGTWSSYTSWMPTWLPERVQDNLSDTAVAAYVVAFFPEILDEIHWATCLASVEDGEISFKYQGTWSSHGGNKFSNLHWLPNYGYKSSPYASDDYSSARWWETWRGRDWSNWARQKTESARREAVISRARISAAKERIARSKAIKLVEAESGFDSGACTIEDLGPDPENEADFSDIFDLGTRDPWDNDSSDLLDRQDYDSWEQYVEAKYGAKVAKVALMVDPDGTELSNSELESLALSNVGADELETEDLGMEDYRGDGEFEDVAEVVSEDYQVVNEYLKRVG